MERMLAVDVQSEERFFFFLLLTSPSVSTKSSPSSKRPSWLASAGPLCPSPIPILWHNHAHRCWSAQEVKLLDVQQTPDAEGVNRGHASGRVQRVTWTLGDRQGRVCRFDNESGSPKSIPSRGSGLNMYTEAGKWWAIMKSSREWFVCHARFMKHYSEIKLRL